MGVMNFIRRELLRKSWRKQNPHNGTVMKEIFDSSAVTVGKYSYGSLQVLLGNNQNRVTIGHFCSIASEVVFIPGSDHHVDRISTFPFKVTYCLRDRVRPFPKETLL